MIMAILAASAALLVQPQAARDTIPATAPRDPIARVTFDFGPTSGTAPTTLVVRGLELGFTNTGTVAVTQQGSPSGSGGSSSQRASAVGTAQARFTKDIGPLTTELAHYGATGARVPNVTVEVLDTLGVTVMRVALSDVIVSSDRIVLSPRDAGLDQQRLALSDAISQLSADLAEAQRQLNLTDVLDKRRLSSTQEVARARERVELLQARLDNQRARMAMLDRQIGAQAPVHEEVLLSFGRFDVTVPGN